MFLRIFISLFTISFTVQTFAQEKKYQSLLWEISGNGLTKKSYMYGTMHVSDKVSYHLSDSFFAKLLEADIVANESDPETWTDMPNVYGSYYGKEPFGFYTHFYITELTKDDLYPLFVGTNYTLTGLLSRTDEMNKEYQEDTYLDMFIYRTGRKYGKKVVGLEDATTSMVNIMKGQSIVDNRDVEENAQDLKKLLKNKNQNDAMMDFYREKDLDMLDSLMTLSSPKPYLKSLLYDRNIVMVNSMDSIMKTGSLFAAVGAAHLAGDKGMIEMLRSMGYTVTPVIDEYTEIGKGKKKEIEEFFIQPVLESKMSSDGMISVPLFKTIIESDENYESADLANGGFINVKRCLLKDFVKKDNIKFDHKTLDSLFYENIPGEILEKKFYQEKNYLVYDIKSKTKTNNAQHYRYYITPLEIITVIMGGEGEYVRKFESLVYDKINIKNYNETFETFSPKKGGFEINLPSYISTVGNKISKDSYADLEVYGYNQSEDAHYFVIENTLDDYYDFEDTEFELKRIHIEFYNQFDADTTNTSLDEDNSRFISESKVGKKPVHLMSIVDGIKYYLVGTVGSSKENSEKFFQSFKLKPHHFNVETTVFVDSSSMFSIEIPKKLNENLDFRFETIYLDDDQKTNHFKADSEQFLFLAPSGQKIELSFYRYHKYDSEKHLDTIWSDFKKFISKDFEKEILNTPKTVDEFGEPMESEVYGKKKLEFDDSRWTKELGLNKIDETNLMELSNEKITSNPAGTLHEMNVTASRPNSNQAIKYKAVVKDGATYLFKTMVPKKYLNEDQFIEKAYSSFTVFDTIFTPSMYENKFAYFVQDANSEYDSIRYSALNSIDFLTITKEDLPSLISFLDEFQFEREEFDAQLSIYRKMGEIQDPTVIAYLEKIYQRENVNASEQLAVLNALAMQESKSGYQKILKLLEYDLPLTDNQSEIGDLFRTFTYDLEHSQVLYPSVFQFYGVKEYANPIMQFTNVLLASKTVNPRKMKEYKKMILTNAKLEYKRLLSWQQNNELQEADDFGFYNAGQVAPTSKLFDNLDILYAFKKEKEVAKLFEKVSNLGLDEVTLYNTRMELLHNNSIHHNELEALMSKPETEFAAYQIMKQTNRTSDLEEIQAATIARAALVQLYNLAPESDSVEFLEQRNASLKGKEIVFYFYKVIDIDEDSYDKNAEKMACVAFLASNGKLNPQAFKTYRNKPFLEESEIQEYIKSSIDETLNEGRPRATFGKLKANEFGFGDFYYDQPYFEGDFPEEEYYEGDTYEEY